MPKPICLSTSAPSPRPVLRCPSHPPSRVFLERSRFLPFFSHVRIRCPLFVKTVAPPFLFVLFLSPLLFSFGDVVPTLEMGTTMRVYVCVCVCVVDVFFLFSSIIGVDVCACKSVYLCVRVRGSLPSFSRSLCLFLYSHRFFCCCSALFSCAACERFVSFFFSPNFFFVFARFARRLFSWRCRGEAYWAVRRRRVTRTWELSVAHGDFSTD